MHFWSTFGALFEHFLHTLCAFALLASANDHFVHRLMFFLFRPCWLELKFTSLKALRGSCASTKLHRYRRGLSHHLALVISDNVTGTKKQQDRTITRCHTRSPTQIAIISDTQLISTRTEWCTRGRSGEVDRHLGSPL